MGIYGLKETAYLKAYPFWNRYPEWMSNTPLKPGPGFEPVRSGILRQRKEQAVPLYHAGHFKTMWEKAGVKWQSMWEEAKYSTSKRGTGWRKAQLTWESGSLRGDTEVRQTPYDAWNYYVGVTSPGIT